MTQYNVYLSGELHAMDLSATDKLSSLRQQLGQAANDYDFVYYNSFLAQKEILNDRSVESGKTVTQVTFPDNTVIMARVGGDKTDLFGTKVDWLYDRHTGVRVTLNQSQDVAEFNQGKFEPMMLTNIQPTNPNSNFYIQRAVICEKGSIINFEVSSWGSEGFGYRITSDKETICDALYAAFGDSPNRQATVGLDRYQDSANMIQIDSTEALQIPTMDVIHYQKITVTSWRVLGYKSGGHTYYSDAQPPSIQAPSGSGFSAMANEFAMAANPSGGFNPGQPAGDTYVDGQDIQSAAPGKGPASSSKFAGGWSDVKEDDPNTQVLGAVIFYFFVFKDHAAANRVINVLNTPNMGAIG